MERNKWIAVWFLSCVLFWLSIALSIVRAETIRKDAAGFTHYYDDSGRQRCLSKRDASGTTHVYCNKGN